MTGSYSINKIYIAVISFHLITKTLFSQQIIIFSWWLNIDIVIKRIKIDSERVTATKGQKDGWGGLFLSFLKVTLWTTTYNRGNKIYLLRFYFMITTHHKVRIISFIFSKILIFIQFQESIMWIYFTCRTVYASGSSYIVIYINLLYLSNLFIV
jgi:hypothetical protein